MLRDRLQNFLAHPDQVKYKKHIKEYINGEKVLDVGCIKHDAEAENSEGWMHSLIEQDAETVLGIDILEDDIATLRKKGYNVEYADAQDFDLNEEFDVIFLGEIIEHLTNIEGLFNCIEKHLKTDGILIITTPNALSVYWSLREIFGENIINSEHTCWFDKSTLSQLLHRFGFEPIQIDYARMSRIRGIRSVYGALGWFIETTFPGRISNRNLIVIAKRSD